MLQYMVHGLFCFTVYSRREFLFVPLKCLIEIAPSGILVMQIQITGIHGYLTSVLSPVRHLSADIPFKNTCTTAWQDYYDPQACVLAAHDDISPDSQMAASHLGVVRLESRAAWVQGVAASTIRRELLKRKELMWIFQVVRNGVYVCTPQPQQALPRVPSCTCHTVSVFPGRCVEHKFCQY